MRLGIDFGTTRTVVAVRDRGNFPIVTFVPASGEPMEHYPSIVVERDGELRFGLDALEKKDDPEWVLVRSFKRLLSAPGARPDQIVNVGSTTRTLLQLTTEFLMALEKDLLTRANLPPRVKNDSDRLQAIVATPANAHNTQRFVTIEAFRAAGFDVVALMNEPSAAGVEYAHRYENTLTGKRDNVLVYDLGGGTFDASIISMGHRRHDVVATRGIQELGGDDFDGALLTMVTDKVTERLLDHARELKESLTPNTKRVVVELESGPVTVEAKDYYEICAPLIAQTLEVMETLVGDRLNEIAGVYVVGGGSSLPIVSRLLRAKYGRRVHRSVYPSASTAIGLAIAFDEQSDYDITERFSRCFGVFREGGAGAEVTFDQIFDPDVALPSPGRARSVERRTYRPVHNIGHFRYVECGWLDDRGSPASEITPFADVRFPFDPNLRASKDIGDVPVERIGEGPLIEETYTVDSAGVVTLQIKDLENGFLEAFELRG